jgi:hypothetical protein
VALVQLRLEQVGRDRVGARKHGVGVEEEIDLGQIVLHAGAAAVPRVQHARDVARTLEVVLVKRLVKRGEQRVLEALGGGANELDGALKTRHCGALLGSEHELAHQLHLLVHTARGSGARTRTLDALIGVDHRAQQQLGLGGAALLGVERLETVANLHGGVANVVDSRIERFELLDEQLVLGLELTHMLFVLGLALVDLGLELVDNLLRLGFQQRNGGFGLAKHVDKGSGGEKVLWHASRLLATLNRFLFVNVFLRDFLNHLSSIKITIFFF